MPDADSEAEVDLAAEQPIVVTPNPARSGARADAQPQFRLRTAMIALTAVSFLFALMQNPFTFAIAMLLMIAACCAADCYIYERVRRRIHELAYAGRSPYLSAALAASTGVVGTVAPAIPFACAASFSGDLWTSMIVVIVTFVVGMVIMSLFGALGLLFVFDLFRRRLSDMPLVVAALALSAVIGGLIIVAFIASVRVVLGGIPFDVLLDGFQGGALLGLLLGARGTHVHLSIVDYNRNARAILNRHRPSAESLADVE